MDLLYQSAEELAIIKGDKASNMNPCPIAQDAFSPKSGVVQPANPQRVHYPVFFDLDGIDRKG